MSETQQPSDNAFASNPFVLPGMGQQSDLSGNPLLASMEMMRQAWMGLAGPGGLAQSMPVNFSVNTEDLERRIAELRAVESWLRMNLSMLSSTIQGMEVQRATVATLRSFVGNLSDTVTGGESSPLEAALGIRRAAPAGDDTGAAPGAEALNATAQSAQAWWNLLQQQFDTLAAATAASMSGANQEAAPKSAAKPAGNAQGAAQKTARKSSRTRAAKSQD